MEVFVGILSLLVLIALCFGGAIKDAYESSKEKKREERIRELRSRRDSYPDAYKAWYGNDGIPYNVSEYDLDRGLSKSIYEWQSKQRSIEEEKEQRERERIQREQRLEQQRKERERVEQKRSQANDICKKYPNAIRKRLGVSSVYSEESAEKVLSLSLRELQLEETELLDEIRRKQAEIDKKYKAIESKYPKGLELVKKLRSSRRAIDEIYSVFERSSIKRGTPVLNTNDRLIRIPEEVYKKFESVSVEYDLMQSWTKKHSDFTDTIPKLCKSVAPNFGYYYYTVSMDGVTETGGNTAYKFKIWQPFYSAHCLSQTIDYGEYGYLKRNAGEISGFLNRGRYFLPAGYDQTVALIEGLGDNCVVVLADSGLGAIWDNIEEYHFKYLKECLTSKGIKYVHIRDIETISTYNPSNIAVVELLSNNNGLKKTCLNILKRCKQFKPGIVYISLRKEYSEDEVVELVERKAREKREAEERERREREARERREREEAERRAREAREAEERRKREEAARRAREEKARLNTLAHTQKNNAWEFRNYLSSNGIRYLYHFTDRRNLDSIRRYGGLYSWFYCENHDISIPFPGGGDQSRNLDRWHGLQDYVRLSFCDDHPMAYRLKQDGFNLVLLRIKIDVALLDETLFSDINAADGAHHHGRTMDDLRRIDLNATQQHYVSSSSPIFKKHQAEVLVKTFIPLEYIENIDNPMSM